MKKIINAISNHGMHLLVSVFKLETEKATVMHWKSALQAGEFRQNRRVGYSDVIALLTPYVAADDNAANLAKQCDYRVAAVTGAPFLLPMVPIEYNENRAFPG